jgi:hypothetical protein
MKRKKHFLRVIPGVRKFTERRKKPRKERQIKTYTYRCGHKNIKLTVEKIEVLKSPENSAPGFYYNCIFCGKDFEPPIRTCPDCNQPLVRINIKKCPQCGAKNNSLKETCWVCAAPFPKLELQPEQETRLLLTLNIEGVYYRNTDQSLAPGVKKLFEDLISSNFNKKPLEAWVRAHEDNVEYKKETFREECKYLLRKSKYKSLVYLFMIVLVIFICFLIVKGFWSG